MIGLVTMLLALLVDGAEEPARALEVSGKERDYLLWSAMKLPPSDWGRNLVASSGPLLAGFYALEVDKGPHNVTRTAASRDPERAFDYALKVDQAPHPVTRQGVLSDPKHALRYLAEVEMNPTETLRSAVLRGEPREIWELAYLVDMRPTPDTWDRVIGTGWEKEYREIFAGAVTLDLDAVLQEGDSRARLAALKTELARVLRVRVALGQTTPQEAQALLRDNDAALMTFLETWQRGKNAALDLDLDPVANVWAVLSTSAVYPLLDSGIDYLHVSSDPGHKILLDIRGGRLLFRPQHLKGLFDPHHIRHTGLSARSKSGAKGTKPHPLPPGRAVAETFVRLPLGLSPLSQAGYHPRPHGGWTRVHFAERRNWP